MPMPDSASADRPSTPIRPTSAAWLAGQLNGEDAGPPGPSVADAFAALREDREDRGQGERPHRARDMFQAETKALEDNAIATPTPFRERLVWFWANHFTVSIRRGEVAPMVGRVCARRDPAACDRAVSRHAAGGDAAPGDAAVSRQCRVGRAEQPRRAAAGQGAEREPGAGVPGAAHGEPGGGLHAGGRDRVARS